ncbi:Na+/H+ antiporter subunit D [Pelagibacterium luteolum]|uniref:Multicomponent Na+:H+ antiporter subunit D n=1 Tax=Pelagibacterium luteolum TaxID=440168 RepID=A0A1G7TTC5_9HYPH|nr:Na+/H+ antiporter subunit D [Pelagibacterium luteolum]SDG38573.1 multicomponent Na+:H+ antiporter subunit D [Pelagibacterium luteolum]
MPEWIETTLLLWPLAVPLGAAALAAAFWSRPAVQSWIGTIGLGITLVASLLLLNQVIGNGIQSKQFGSWAAPFGVSFVADPFSAAMVVISSLLAFAAAIFGLTDLSDTQKRAGFYPLFLGLMVGVNGAFLTGDIFNLYVWFEVMLITALGLLTLDKFKSQLDGAIKYAVLNLFSTILFLMAIGLLYGVTGTLNMADLAVVLPQTEPSGALLISALLFLLGFGIKAGFFPMFFWLPASYHTASIVVSAVFAGLLTKVGVYAAFRVFTLLFEVDNAGIREMIAVFAAGTMLFGVFGAAIQWDIRRILSFHIISQIGYIMMGLAISTQAAMAGAVFYIIHHIIVKANLFLLAGAIYRTTGTYDLRQSGGLMKGSPWLAVLFVIPALSLAGIPPLSGFWAKFMVIDASFRDEAAWLGGVALFVGLLTIFSMSKIWIEAFWKDAPNPRNIPARLHITVVAPITALAAITVAIGVNPEPLVAYAQLAADAMLQPAAYIDAVLGRIETAEVLP